MKHLALLVNKTWLARAKKLRPEWLGKDDDDDDDDEDDDDDDDDDDDENENMISTIVAGDSKATLFV